MAYLPFRFVSSVIIEQCEIIRILYRRAFMPLWTFLNLSKHCDRYESFKHEAYSFPQLYYKSILGIKIFDFSKHLTEAICEVESVDVLNESFRKHFSCRRKKNTKQLCRRKLSIFDAFQRQTWKTLNITKSSVVFSVYLCKRTTHMVDKKMKTSNKTNIQASYWIKNYWCTICFKLLWL